MLNTIIKLTFKYPLINYHLNHTSANTGFQLGGFPSVFFVVDISAGERFQRDGDKRTVRSPFSLLNIYIV